MLFNVMVVLMFLYGVEVWGGTISLVHGMKQRKFKNCSYIEYRDLNPQHLLTSFPRNATLNRGLVHRGASYAKSIDVYTKNREYAKPQILNTSFEYRMEGTQCL